MQDFCFHADSESAIIAALESLGLTIPDLDGRPRPIGTYCFDGRVMDQPGEYAMGTDGATAVIREPTYLHGVFAKFRATDEQAAAIVVAALPAGVEIVEPPANLPRFGGEWIGGPSLEDTKNACISRLQAEKWTRMLGVFRDSKGHLYAVDNDSRALLTGKVAMFGATGKPLPPGFFWKTAETDANGQPICVPHDAETLLALAVEIETWTSAVFSTSETAQVAVRSATDSAQVAAIEASIVWPTN